MSTPAPPSSLESDIAIVGAGPTGATAAIAFAKRGARVMLIDGFPGAMKRFAGEWIHPPGVRTLRSLGVDVDALGARRGHGLAIFADDGGDPVCLPYAGEYGVARLHEELVEHLREHACGMSGVTYLPQHVFAGLDGHAVSLEDRVNRRRVTVRAGRIIGADGRSSKVRAALGAPSRAQELSYLAGLELVDAPLPFEGLGQVFLGGPGPAFLYRIDERRVRACLDIPVWHAPGARQKDAVYQAFRRVLSPQLDQALRAAVERPIAWAATGFRARTFYGRGDVWLAGDAIGHVHPLSGVGITLGVMDAAAAASSTSLVAYRRERDAHVAELLASVLYLAFSRKDASALRIRHGLIRMLRASAAERSRTMRLLTGDDRAETSFADAFLRASSHVVLGGMGKSAAGRQSWSDWGRTLRQDVAWLEWPLRAFLPSADPERARGALERHTVSFDHGSTSAS